MKIPMSDSDRKFLPRFIRKGKISSYSECVGLRGFEPPTPGPPDQCANQTAPQPASTPRYRGYATDPQFTSGSTYLLNAPVNTLQSPPAQIDHRANQNEPEMPGDRTRSFGVSQPVPARGAVALLGQEADIEIPVACLTPGHGQHSITESTPGPN